MSTFKMWCLVLVLFVGLVGCLEEEKAFQSAKAVGADVAAVDTAVEGQDLGLGSTDVEDVDTQKADVTEAEIEAVDAVDTQDSEDAADIVVAADADVQLDGSSDSDGTDQADVDVVEDVADGDSQGQDDAEPEVLPPDVTQAQDVDSDIVGDEGGEAQDAAEVAETDVAADELDSAETSLEDIDVSDSETSTDSIAETESDAPLETASPDVEQDADAGADAPEPCVTLNCDDKNPCTLDLCDNAVGCSNAPTAVVCDDGDACTVSDTCVFGVCTAAAAKKCNDGNPCTFDSCDSKTGCVYMFNIAPCEDGDLCTSGEVCSGGACTVGAAKNCDDGNVCTVDSCDPVTGCKNAPTSNACSDGNLCTESDACSAGACVAGVIKSCDDGNACTNDACDAQLGCSNTKNWVVYDYKDATLTTEWTLTGDMGVSCKNAYFSGLFKESCVIWVQEGAPAWGISTATLDLEKARVLNSMGNGDLRITFKWARFQFINNLDTQLSLILSKDGTPQAQVGIGGNEGTTKIQEFVVGISAAKLQFKLILDYLSLKTGPAVWGKVTVAPVACTPPK